MAYDIQAPCSLACLMKVWRGHLPGSVPLEPLLPAKRNPQVSLTMIVILMSFV